LSRIPSPQLISQIVKFRTTRKNESLKRIQLIETHWRIEKLITHIHPCFLKEYEFFSPMFSSRHIFVCVHIYIYEFVRVWIIC